MDWSSANIGAYEFRQPPGPTNVLGTIKFMFPNKHDVYMHDTPERDLFARSFRGLSHGCMRVAIRADLPRSCSLKTRAGRAQVGNLLNGGTREVELTTRIPVHVTYFTAMVDGQGNLRTPVISTVSIRAWAQAYSAAKFRSSRRATTTR